MSISQNFRILFAVVGTSLKFRDFAQSNTNCAWQNNSFTVCDSKMQEKSANIVSENLAVFNQTPLAMSGERVSHDHHENMPI